MVTIPKKKEKSIPMNHAETVTMQRKTFNVNEPETLFGNKGSTYKGGKEERNNLNEPKTVFSNKGSTYKGGKEERNNINEPKTLSNKARTYKRSQYKENEKEKKKTFNNINEPETVFSHKGSS